MIGKQALRSGEAGATAAPRYRATRHRRAALTAAPLLSLGDLFGRDLKRFDGYRRAAGIERWAGPL